MAYYDDNGEYVGYDPYEAYEKRIHEEKYHKSEVLTTEDLLRHEFVESFVQKSKQDIPIPEYKSDDPIEQYLDSMSAICANIFGDFSRAHDMITKYYREHVGEIEILKTSKEHIVRNGTDTFIVYKVCFMQLEVLGVFFDREVAEKFAANYHKYI